MVKFIKQKEYIRAVVLTLLSFFLIVTNQNCTPKDLGALTSKKGLSSLSGGEAYDGKLKPGTYVHEVIQMGCEGNSANERAAIKVGVNSDIALSSKSAIDCGVSDTKLQLSDLDHYADNPNYIAHAGQIFKRLPKLKEGWVTEIWCRAKDSKQTLNFYADYNPATKESINRMSKDLKLEEQAAAERSLVDTDLVYKSTNWQVDIDLSSEVFLGARKYNAKLKEKEVVKDLFCYAGSGVLPRTTAKKIDSSIFTNYNLNKISSGLSPDKHVYLHATTDNDLLNLDVKILDLLSGEESLLTATLPYKVRLVKSEWLDAGHENLFLVLAKEEFEVIEGSLLEGLTRDFILLEVRKTSDGYELNKILESKYAVNNVNKVYYGMLQVNTKGMAWAHPSAEINKLDFHSYDFSEQIERQQSYDLSPLLQEIETLAGYKRTLMPSSATIQISDNFNKVLFKIESEGLNNQPHDVYMNLNYINLESGYSAKVSTWSYWSYGLAAKWINDDNFIFSEQSTSLFARFDYDFVLLVKRASVGPTSVDTVEILKSKGHQLGSVQQDSNNKSKVLLSLIPHFFFKDYLPKKFINLDLSTNKVIDTLVFNKKYAWFADHLYIPFFNRVLVQYRARSGGGISKVFFAALNLNTEVYSNDQQINYDFFNSHWNYNYAVKANKHLFAIEADQFQGELLKGKYTVREYSAQGTKHNFKPYLTNLLSYEYIEGAERIIYSKMVNSTIQFYLRDLLTGQTVNLVDKLNLSVGNILYGVETVKNSSSLILKVSKDDVTTGYASEYDTYILSLEDL